MYGSRPLLYQTEKYGSFQREIVHAKTQILACDALKLQSSTLDVMAEMQ